MMFVLVFVRSSWQLGDCLPDGLEHWLSAGGQELGLQLADAESPE